MTVRTQLSILIGAAMCLSACVGSSGMLGGLSDIKPVATLKGEGTASNSTTPSLTAANTDTNSPIISDLLSRRSVLRDGSAYDRVAEAELRASKMRAVARSKNWLPTIGPSISLDALGQVAAGLLVDMTLYDNGKRRAERAFAAADVEVSAVALSQDMNDRLYEGLTLYITISEAREKAGMAERGLGRMNEFNRVVTERVKGGASSLSDQRVVRSIISEMEHEARTHREAEDSARAELAALTGGAALPALDQATGVALPPSGLTSLEVMRAEAEAKRAVAEAQAERAAMLPTLSASTLLGQGNSSSVDYAGAGLGLGTSAEMEASRAREAAATAAIDKARETAARRDARLTNHLTALRRQERDAADLVQQTAPITAFSRINSRPGKNPSWTF